MDASTVIQVKGDISNDVPVLTIRANRGISDFEYWCIREFSHLPAATIVTRAATVNLETDSKQVRIEKMLGVS